MKKLLALVLTAVMVLAMAVPAFAEGHKTPEVVITNETADGYYVSGSTVKYEFTIYCSDCASKIKVGNKTLKMSDFKDNKDDSYTYKGSVNIGLTDTNLKFYVYDLKQGNDATWEETVKFKVDPTVPNLNVTAVKTGSAFSVGLISIIATDNVGLAKITVNGKTIADEFTNKKAYVTNYNVPAAGSYVVTATDTAGNVSISTVTFNADGSTSTESVTNPLGGNLWTGSYVGGLASVYKDNPQLYYYIKMLQDNGEIEDSWMLWYMLSQQTPSVPGNSTSSSTTATTNSNWYILYNYIMKNEDMSETDKQLLYYYLANGNLGSLNTTIPTTNLYWYLYQTEDLGIDKTLLYYYLANGGNVQTLDPSIFKDNYLAYDYFFGFALDFVDGAEISDMTKEGKLTLTAPAIKNDSKVTYTWKTLSNGSWKTIGADSNTLTVTPVLGAKYKVVISSDYYYTTVTSDTLTVTKDMLENDADVVVPDVDDDDKDNESKFSASDITINGVTNNVINLKVGQKAYLIPNYNGYWVYDTTMFSGSGSSLIALTANKAGTTVIAFTAVKSNGDTATKQILVVVNE